MKCTIKKHTNGWWLVVTEKGERPVDGFYREESSARSMAKAWSKRSWRDRLEWRVATCYLTEHGLMWNDHF